MPKQRTSSAPARQRGRPALNRTTPLERDDIIDCALAIVQKEGRDAVSMRRLAKELGVTPMAIYHHVSDKPALMDAMVERVWKTIYQLPVKETDLVEMTVETCLKVRKVWLSYFDLASLAVAVAEPDDTFFRDATVAAEMAEITGFPDVPLAASAVLNFTMGTVEIAANRRMASQYFGRDPKAIRAKALRLLHKRNASENLRGVVEARFDEGDEIHFEAALRALIAGLLAA